MVYILIGLIDNMKNSKFIYLIKDFIRYNNSSENKLNLKNYMMQILNYDESTANEINNKYNRIMRYS